MLELERRQFLAIVAAGLVAPRFPFVRAPRWERIAALQDPSLERRKAYLALLRRLLEPTWPVPNDRINAQGDKTWEAWLARTGELPPDFQLMPSSAELPDPLVLLDDRSPRRITTVADWRRQRVLIRERLDHWLLGTMPPAPGNVRGTVTATTKEGETTVQQVRLEFGPEHRGTLRIQLYIPPGDGPFPVFMSNHQRLRPWVNGAVRRGYIGCSYQAIDDRYGIADDSHAWVELYPEYDFKTMARYAWGAMRAMDYLHTLPIVDRKRIAISGHSRNSKQALVAAAYDERFGAVAASRGNSGDAIPWRYADDMYVSESLEEVTRAFPNWFQPRLRFFVGQEHKLPFDQNLLLSLVAPRGLLLSHAYTEHQGNAMGLERAYRSVREVYRFLGSERNVGLKQEPGEHPSSAEDVQQYLDFFDTVFGRTRFPHPETWVHGYSYAEWLRSSGEQIAPRRHPERRPGTPSADLPAVATAEAWPERRRRIQESIRWVMGVEPPGIAYPVRTAQGVTQTSEGWQGQLLDRPRTGLQVRDFHFGDDLQGYLYLPDAKPSGTPPSTRWTDAALTTANLPVVIWLHPYSYATGFYNSYATGYAENPHWAPLMNRGFAVVAFDQIGFGSRAGHGRRFYQRHPRWSILGKMSADVRAAIDVIAQSSGTFDLTRVYLYGHALGAKVALHTAALDDRVQAVSASCGFTPLRTPATAATEGLRHYSHLHGLLPRLGFFIGHESRVPVDYDEILSAVAPRPVQVIAPTLDRHAPVEDVRRAVDTARGTYRLLGRESALQLDTPEEFNRYPKLRMLQLDWLTRQAGLPVPAAEAAGTD